jgi:predicted glycoside hydrolase/deacetylase ChbG (UPF0249 family)
MIKPSKFKIKQRKATKTHICNNCYAKINLGETYNTQVYFLYGRFGVNKSHIDCKHSNEIFKAIGGFFKALFRSIFRIKRVN